MIGGARIHASRMGCPKKLFVTGGAGFIGANFVLLRVRSGGSAVNLDLRTFAGNPLRSAEVYP